jgi:maltose O-acetyltransferase
MSGRAASLIHLARRLARAMEEEVAQLRPFHHVLDVASRAIPPRVGNQLRTAALRARGIDVGEGTEVYGAPEFSGGESGFFAKMTIGRDSVIGIRCSFELGETITIGNRVTLGHNVMILTTSHELGPREHRAGAIVRSPVRLEDGAWVGARAIILPGVTVGAGAVVEPGSVVNKNVAPNTRVRGTPARPVEMPKP